MIALVLVGVGLLVAGGVFLWLRLRRPKGDGFRHRGRPPTGADEFLEALRRHCPHDMPWIGEIEWVDVLWPDASGALVEGEVIDHAARRLRLLRQEHSWRATLPKLIDHLRRDSATEPDRAWLAKATARLP